MVPAGNWETVYAHSAPTGLGAARVQKTEPVKEGGEQGGHGMQGEWLSPIVDARKGAVKTAMGRMAKSAGKEHEDYVEAEYQDVV